MNSETAARLDLAHDVVRKAGELLLGFADRDRDTAANGASEHVSPADHAVLNLISDAVGRYFPDDAVLGEAGGNAEARQLWVVDPIDGYANFVRGLPSYAISIAYVEDGRVDLGVVHLPMLRETFAALRGYGAFCNDRPIRVSDCRSLVSARIGTGYAQRGSKAQYLRFLGRLLRAGADIVNVSSAAVSLAFVAAGRIDGYFERELMAWDALAGQLLVCEAGGYTNDFGARGLEQRDYALAAGPALVDVLRAAANI